MNSLRSTIEDKHDLIILALIIATGGILRFWALDFGLPNPLCRPDELTIISKAWHFWKEPNPHFFNYPTLFLYFLFFCYVVYFAFGFMFGRFDSLAHFHRYYYDNIPHFILISRGISVLLGTISIYLIYRLGKKCYSREVGITSALLFSLTYLHVRDSHFGATDATMTFMIILAYIFIADCLIRGDVKSYLLAGLLSGLATSTKYNAMLLVIPIFVAHLLSSRARGENFQQILLSRRLWLAYGIMALAFALTSPYVLLDIHNFIKTFRHQKAMLKYGYGLDLGIGWWYHLKISLRYGMGLPYLITALCGIAFTIYRHQDVDLILLSFPLVYYLGIGSGKGVFVRYIIPALPFLSIFSAVLLNRIIKTTVIPKKILVNSVAVLLLIPSIYNIINCNLLLSREDTRVTAQRWIEKHIPQNSPLLISNSYWGLPLTDYTRYQLYCFNHDKFNLKMKPHTKPYRDDAVDYAVTVESFLPLYTSVSSELSTFLQNNQFKVVKEFNPFNNKIKEDKPFYNQIDALFLPYYNFKGVDLPGPLIRIHKRTGTE
jgi:hypothetical protein